MIYSTFWWKTICDVHSILVFIKKRIIHFKGRTCIQKINFSKKYMNDKK